MASIIPSHLVMTLALFFALALAGVQLSAGHGIKGSVTCLDCDANDDLSGIKVLVKCSNVKKVVVATTVKDGTFQIELPKDSPTTPPSTPSLKCLAKILGGPSLLYTLGKKTIADVAAEAKGRGGDYYTNTQPLNFYKSCPAGHYAKCAAASTAVEFGSSKTVDIPLPREWGLAPSSYYFPFIPIIGIP